MRFEFATATRIIFGRGVLQEMAPLAANLGRKAIIITGRSTDRAEQLFESLEKQKIDSFLFHVSTEPTTDTVREGTEIARQALCNMVIGIGGGSVMDTGKAIAAILANEGDVLDYLEVIGKGKPITRRSAPYIAIPTTAGTGAEVTKNAVLRSPEHKVKVSMRSLLMLPRLAVVDPLLTVSMPPDITASTGLDALTQLLEAFVYHKQNPLTDGICREGLKRAAGSLRRAYTEGEDLSAREDMSLASLFGGLALANAGLGAVHGFAGPLGGMFSAPHGKVCASLLPFVLEANIQAIKSRTPNSPALIRFNELAALLTGNPDASIQEGVSWIHDLCQDLNVPSLSSFGIKEEDIPAVVEKSRKSSSMKGNPVDLTDEELTQILKKAL